MLNGDRITRRRFLTLAGGAAGALAMPAALARAAYAARREAGRTQPIRIGAVLPLRANPQQGALYDVVGEAARMGATMAGDELDRDAAEAGFQLKVLQASSPTAEAATRAAERLVATEEVCALVGGLGAGQAAAISRVAEERRVPFFNIGTPRLASEPGLAGPYTFHVEASADTYLAALADFFVGSGHRRWYVVHEETEEGEALYSRAVQAITGRHSGTEVTGRVAVPPSYPNYFGELQVIDRANPDVVLLLTRGSDQLNFLGQFDSLGLSPLVTGFPHALTQTRDFFWSYGEMARPDADRYRAMLWEPTLERDGAKELNDRFLSRWGTPMDPSAWAAYAATKMAYEAVRATSSTDGSEIVGYLESSRAAFDLGKGMDLSFGPSDHQLRQPVYFVRINPDVRPNMDGHERLGLARLAHAVTVS